MDYTKAIALVDAELEKQLNKHGFTPEWQYQHPEYYDDDQLLDASKKLLSLLMVIKETDGLPNPPKNWDWQRWNHLINHSFEDRLIMAASFICAHHDYLKYIQNRKNIKHGNIR